MHEDMSLLEQETQLESGAISEAVARYRNQLAEAKSSGSDLLLFTPEMVLLMRTVPTLSKAIRAWMIPKAGGDKSSHSMRRILLDLDTPEKMRVPVHPDELSILTIRHCFNHYLGQETIQAIAISLADDIRVHKDDLKFQKAFKGYHKVVSRSIQSDHPGHRHKVLTHARHKMGVADSQWDKDFKLVFGKILIDLFLDTAKMFTLDTYTKPKKRYSKKLKRMVRNIGITIKPTEETLIWLDENHEKCEVLAPILKPMVVEPETWTGVTTGGYVSPAFAQDYQSCRLVRESDLVLLKKQEPEIAPEVYEGLNTIQKTPYRINSRVLAVVEELRESGLAGLPDGKLPALKLPPKPWMRNGEDHHELWKKNYPDVVSKWSAQAHKLYQDYWNEKSKRTSLNEKIRLAKMFDKYERFWFPVNLDWRGRTYCMSTPVLTPQGDDAAKGLLEYADTKPLGESGVTALKIHGANCGGQDKKPLADRLLWVDVNEENIREIARDPFGELQMQMWGNVDEPFQFLAFCFDYAKVLRVGSEHCSRLICAIDQTCSGLQHWSAVLHDEKGAAEVGMVDKSEPDDVYSKVADVVSNMVENDDDPLAALWLGKVTRTITKRNVMTKLYGATMPGMRDQVAKELKDLDKKQAGRYLGESDVDNYQAARYIAQMNTKGMAAVVEKADQGMQYVQKIAKMLAEEGLTVNWTSPIGLPIEQTYWRTDTKVVDTYWISVKLNMDSQRVRKEKRKSQRVQLCLTHPIPGRVQVKKAENSIAPNYIHSMDASHLLFTAIGWGDKGMTNFTPVHDSFGCHACDIAELHKVVREQFVMMYEDHDYLAEFADGIAEYFPAVREEEQPWNGDFDFNQVIDSTYFSH
jgi:DNA-directed RNA polymerase